MSIVRSHFEWGKPRMVGEWELRKVDTKGGGGERRDSVSVFLLLARESHNKTVNITI